MIKAKDIRFTYKKSSKFALQCDSFDAFPSKITCIIGGNGSGKTTLLKVLGGLVKLRTGSVSINDKVICDILPKKLNSLVGWIDSSISLSLVENLYVLDHFALALLAAGEKIPLFYRYINTDSYKNTRTTTSDCFKHIEMFSNKQIGNLSSGQRQNITIALTSILSKKVIFADESTSNLDIYHSKQFFESMKYAAIHNSSTIVIVTHDILLASEFADSMYCLNNGVVQKIDIDKERLDDRITLCKSLIFNEKVNNRN